MSPMSPQGEPVLTCEILLISVLIHNKYGNMSRNIYTVCEQLKKKNIFVGNVYNGPNWVVPQSCALDPLPT